MRPHRVDFESMRKRLGMYFLTESYAEVAGFFSGYDTACEGGLLSGFREWLAVRLGYGANLAWQALVLHVAFPDARSPVAEFVETSPDQQKHAINTLFDLFAEFDAQRNKQDGLKDIYVAFENWMAAELRDL